MRPYFSAVNTQEIAKADLCITPPSSPRRAAAWQASRHKQVSSRRQLCTHSWQGIQEEAAASAAPGISRNNGAYAVLPFKQWLSPNGQWRVRPMREEELAAVARIQAQAFYEASPIAPLDSLLYYIFQGGVLSSLQEKIKYSKKGFCCLVVTSVLEPSKVKGAVEISLQGEKEELRVLQENGFEEDSYAYVACMAVDREARRTGAATALLGAAERMAGKWQQNFVLLHTYADNFPGLRLYHRNGYADLMRDPDWRSLFGLRKRVLMAKSASVFSMGNAVQSISTNILKAWTQQQEQESST
ncbi:hypothetical protein CVIRNUC_001968 [Coccomyxa viridis]|uniref:N-acetyltransferase domain-containing protein n=1 Tax=Coccomyxa viridis TaxID=1274662 RepID=A0AAV1HXQ4_9CHLO|nr:hypothetical protein CVIRNUC_001968 [Coccomyxa viridis]